MKKIKNEPIYTYCARIFKQSKGARNRIGTGLSYRPPKLHRLADLIPWNRFLGSLKVKKFGLCWYLSQNEIRHSVHEYLKPCTSHLVLLLQCISHLVLVPRISYLVSHTSYLVPRTLVPRTSHPGPRTSHLGPPTSHLAPRTSHLRHELRTSYLVPRTSNSRTSSHRTSYHLQ